MEELLELGTDSLHASPVLNAIVGVLSTSMWGTAFPTLLTPIGDEATSC